MRDGTCVLLGKQQGGACSGFALVFRAAMLGMCTCCCLLCLFVRIFPAYAFRNLGQRSSGQRCHGRSQKGMRPGYNKS